jgi:23S rRNA pseudouridine2605 synthase
VRVNGRVARLGDSADPLRDAVSVDGVRVGREPCVYWLLHKPKGVITTVRDPQGRPTVVGLVPDRRHRLFPVGRLDRDTEGLLLLTNDGRVAQALLHPSYQSEREYEVEVRGRIDVASLRRLAGGVELEDGRTAPARVGPCRYDAEGDSSRFALTLVEGRKRQIRRALDALGHPVRRLVRVRMGPLRLGRLAPGAARELGAAERRALLAAVRAAEARSAEAASRHGPGSGRS